MLAPLTYILALLVEPEVSLADLDLFPPPEAVNDCRKLAQDHVGWLEARLHGLGDPWGENLQEALLDARRRERAWYLLAWSRNVECTLESRLADLRELRDLLGYPAYYRGEMPAPMDLNRLTIH